MVKDKRLPKPALRNGRSPLWDEDELDAHDKAARKAETEKVAREPARHEAETEKAAVP
jgi:hypothetical protein